MSKTQENMEFAGQVLRFVTPLLVTVSLFILTQVWQEAVRISNRLYEHQTNQDLHTPRGEFVSLRQDIENLRKEVIHSIREQGGRTNA